MGLNTNAHITVRCVYCLELCDLLNWNTSTYTVFFYIKNSLYLIIQLGNDFQCNNFSEWLRGKVFRMSFNTTRAKKREIFVLKIVHSCVVGPPLPLPKSICLKIDLTCLHRKLFRIKLNKNIEVCMHKIEIKIMASWICV